MFSGIIEAVEPVLESNPRDRVVELRIRRPECFDDIKVGDSIAVNGVCLTVESFDAFQMTFTLGFESIKVLGSALATWVSHSVNLERSLAFGARIHGHLVSGHVEAVVSVVKSEPLGENWLLTVLLPEELKKFCWKKGSIALQGVSLTINALENNHAEVCLIPETQRRTNLTQYKVGEFISCEPDLYAKAAIQALAEGLVCSGGSDV